MPVPRVSQSEFASPKLALVEMTCESPPETWRSLSDVVSRIVREVEVRSAAEAGNPPMPKAA